MSKKGGTGHAAAGPGGTAPGAEVGRSDAR